MLLPVVLGRTWRARYRYCVKCGSKRKVPTQSPPENIKRTKTLDDFIQEKGKERHDLSKKRFGTPLVPPLVPGHKRSKHPQTYVQRF